MKLVLHAVGSVYNLAMWQNTTIIVHTDSFTTPYAKGFKIMICSMHTIVQLLTYFHSNQLNKGAHQMK